MSVATGRILGWDRVATGRILGWDRVDPGRVRRLCMSPQTPGVGETSLG